MKAWVDLSDLIQWPHPHLTGIQRVVIEAGLAMAELHPDVGYFNYHPEQKKFLVVDPSTIHFARECQMTKVRTTADEANFKSEDRIYLLGGTWVYPGLIAELQKQKDRHQFQVVQFIHDVTPIKMPHVHRDKSKEIMERWLRELDALVDICLTNSEFSRKEIEDVFQQLQLKSKKFKVVRLGDKLPTKVPGARPELFKNLQTGFVLCVGSFEPRKNPILLYQAWHLLRQKYGANTLQLVFVGRPGWQSEDFKSLMFRDPILQNKLSWFQSATESELAWLYQNCSFSIYPSIYEGWGLPVAEALAYGKFCIASNAASIPEIAGGMIDYFDPFDSRDCFQKIERCLDDSGYLKSREQSLKSSFRITPWTETARQCLDIGVKDKK